MPLAPNENLNVPEICTLTVSGQAVAVILDVLHNAPYRVAQPIIDGILDQIRAMQPKPIPLPEPIPEPIPVDEV